MNLKYWKRILKQYRVRFDIRHLYGPKRVALENHEAAVTCVVKNGKFYIPSFIEHYTQMGFRHIFFLDNGSTDGTISLAKHYSNVTIYECKLPVGSYQRLLKRCLAKMAVPAGWCLDVDIDEFFEYPMSNKIKLGEFLNYLNKGHYSAILTQMLDLFSDRTIASLADNDCEQNLKKVYRFYDLSEITRIDYQEADLTRRFGALNQLGNTNAQLFFGGIRKKLFGINCLLTKHSLFRTNGHPDLFNHVHYTNNVKVADVSCLLLHYKLVGNCYETSSINTKAFPKTRKGYEDLVQLIERKPELMIKSERAKEYRTPAELLDENFIFASSDYLRYAKDIQANAINHLN